MALQSSRSTQASQDSASFLGPLSQWSQHVPAGVKPMASCETTAQAYQLQQRASIVYMKHKVYVLIILLQIVPEPEVYQSSNSQL